MTPRKPATARKSRQAILIENRGGKPQCTAHGSNHQRCVRPAGHTGRHITSAEYFR